MLGVKAYTAEYVDSCRRGMEQRLAALGRILGAAGETADDVQAFEASYLADMAMLLDYFFVHRLRVIEGKDGNALNEVRLIANSLLNNGGIMQADRTIKYTPERSVSKCRIGDEIRLDEAKFRALADAFFAEIERKFI